MAAALSLSLGLGVQGERVRLPHVTQARDGLRRHVMPGAPAAGGRGLCELRFRRRAAGEHEQERGIGGPEAQPGRVKLAQGGIPLSRFLAFDSCFFRLVGLGLVHVSENNGLLARRLGSGEVMDVLVHPGRFGFQRHVRAWKKGFGSGLGRALVWNRGVTAGGGEAGYNGSDWSHVCEASKKGNNNPQSTPPEEDSDPKRKQGDGQQSDDASRSSFPRPPMVPETDWRLVRARLVAGEQAPTGSGNGGDAAGDLKAAAAAAAAAADSAPASGGHAFYPAVGKRWAHPILAPEAGAVLIASEKLDGMPNFERSVVLLLNGGPVWSKVAPYGIILNQPLPRRIKHVKPKDQALVKTFGACQVHVGGPLETNKFLLLHATPGVKNFREVIPGVYCGSSEGLEPAAEMARAKNALPQDLRFFFGYTGWGTDQLKKEIALGLWHVAACSTDLITGISNAGLWEEILLLMGGKYAELSKRPRRKL